MTTEQKKTMTAAELLDKAASAEARGEASIARTAFNLALKRDAEEEKAGNCSLPRTTV